MLSASMVPVGESGSVGLFIPGAAQAVKITSNFARNSGVIAPRTLLINWRSCGRIVIPRWRCRST
ncbi:hypothetical protein UG54_07375 [Gordonia sihwensis]|nr:hypothetical protein UG54_07375 [Gordonia sihwensis]